MLTSCQVNQMNKDELISLRIKLIEKINHFICTSSGKSMISPDIYWTLSQVDTKLTQIGFPQENPFPELYRSIDNFK
ncbi:hypothetical protein SDC9_150271 [bioreactor metagenome]|uniref:Uncharacterized protein n=1 Tax=bioreactor metagenome TaxID=1076179 RepID=A0A645EM01_9ZZZZ